MTNVARTGQTLLVVASSMLFAAVTSAMVVRRGIGGDWVAPAVPAWVWATAVLGPLASWLLLRGWVRGAVIAGGLLVGLQVLVLAELRMAVIGEAFLSVLVAAHAIHAAAGVAALARWGERTGLFWHFVGALWIYVLFLFGVWA
jgi:hypothetical protein